MKLQKESFSKKICNLYIFLDRINFLSSDVTFIIIISLLLVLVNTSVMHLHHSLWKPLLKVYCTSGKKKMAFLHSSKMLIKYTQTTKRSTSTSRWTNWQRKILSRHRNVLFAISFVSSTPVNKYFFASDFCSKLLYNYPIISSEVKIFSWFDLEFGLPTLGLHTYEKITVISTLILCTF